MDDHPARERIRLVSADAVVNHLTYADARAMLEGAEAFDLADARELAGAAVGPAATRSEILDAIATMLASGELCLMEHDPHSPEFEMPAGFFDEATNPPAET